MRKVKYKYFGLHPRECWGMYSWIHHFPWWALVWSFVYAGLSALVLLLYKNVIVNYTISQYEGAHEIMFNYIILIIAWLITARPVYALAVHDKLTEKMHDILEDLFDYLKEESSEKGKADLKLLDGHWASVFKYIVTSASTSELPLLSPIEFPIINDKKIGHEGAKKLKTILKNFREFQMQQTFASPQALHGMCHVLLFTFHVILLPILLYENESSFWATVVSNFILAVYSHGCIQVALNLENPYENVTIHKNNLATTYFQTIYNEIMHYWESTNSGFTMSLQKDLEKNNNFKISSCDGSLVDEPVPV